MNIEDLVVEEKYLVDDNPVWEDGTPGALRDYDVAYVVYRRVWENDLCPDDAVVIAYDSQGREIGQGGEFIVAARCLRPYGEPVCEDKPTAEPPAKAVRPPYLTEAAEQRLQLLRRIQLEFPGGSLEELLVAARWVWGEAQ